ncbi:WDGH domain-containing protein [Bacillus mojavensis]
MKFEFDVERKGLISDGYHTFDELYYHRMILFSIICNSYKENAWKSWLHNDGSMYRDYFIAGVKTDHGDYTYHYHKNYWDLFDVEELAFAPEWDGHEPKDINRLFSLVGKDLSGE